MKYAVALVSAVFISTAGCSFSANESSESQPPQGSENTEVKYDLAVCGFFSDSVGRYDAKSGEFLGNFPDQDLDGALAARIGSDGLLYVASEMSNEVRRYNAETGELVDVFIEAGAGGLKGPASISWDQSGNLIVASFNSAAILKYDGKTGAFIDAVKLSDEVSLKGPDNGTIVGPDGMLYIPSYGTNQVLRCNLKEQTTEVFIEKIGQPRVLVFKDDHLYITSEATDAVLRFDLSGKLVDKFIQPGSEVLDEPVGLVFVNDHWFVTSAALDKVVQFDADGKLVNADFIETGSGGMDGPVFITPVPQNQTK